MSKHLNGGHQIRFLTPFFALFLLFLPTMIGQGRNTHEIASELGIAVSTVETYRERLKTKLNLSSGSELTRHALFWMMQNS